MVNEMRFRIVIFCLAWSPVLISLAGLTEAYASVLDSATKSKETATFLADLLGVSDFVQREAQATKVAKNGRVELSDFQTRFPVPRVIERLQLAAEEALPDVALPQADVIPTRIRAPVPQTEPANLADVSLNCSRTEFTVWVKRAFYGFAAKQSELTLGRTCKSNGVDESSGSLLFTYPLKSCDVREEVVRVCESHLDNLVWRVFCVILVGLLD